MYILTSSDYYNIPEDKIGTEMATMNSISEVVNIVQSFFLGVITIAGQLANYYVPYMPGQVVDAMHDDDRDKINELCLLMM